MFIRKVPFALALLRDARWAERISAATISVVKHGLLLCDVVGASRALRWAVGIVGVLLAIAAAALAGPELVVLDTLTGLTLVGVGLMAWSRQSRSRTGALMAVSGLAWFLGSFFG